MRGLARAVLCALLVGGSALAVSAQAPATWRGSWGAAPAPPMPAGAGVPKGWASPVIAGRTMVLRLRLSAGGTRLRLRLSNEFGPRPLTLGHVRVDLLDATGKPGTGADVMFAGNRRAVIAAGAPLVSDPVALTVPALAQVQVSIYLPGAPVPCTCHADGGDVARLSPPGDYVGRPFRPIRTIETRPFLTAVDVEGGPASPVIVALGDSITDGFLSTTGTNRRWPDRLAERLVADPGLGAAAVVNAGIGGNRLLNDDPILTIFGRNALARFDRDVLAVPGITHLIVLEGINDICMVPTIDADALIAGYQQIIRRAHARGVKVFLATIMPYGHTPYFSRRGEAVRQAANAWIRTQRDADGVIDFDALMRDPLVPTRLRASLQAGDWLHPNDAGYRTMGEGVPLALFR